jgi:beta-galactosidase/beta-glucuronidase
MPRKLTVALTLLLATLHIYAQSAASVTLPAGVKAVWDPAKAFRESTPTRERLSINGLWLWQPSSGVPTAAAPTSGWGYLRVPEPWPSGNQRNPSRVFYPNPAWDRNSLRTLKTAWYQREITIPREWTGRRITVYVEHLNSYAAVYLDGKQVGEMRYPAGEVDLTSAARPGQTQVLGMRVDALPLKAVMESFRDTATARTIEGTVQRKGLCGDVYLTGTPVGPRIEDVRVVTSVRQWQISIDTTFTALDPNTTYALRATITDAGRQVKQFTTKPFKPADLADGRLHTVEAWHPEKLWDTITPQNQYVVSLSLLSQNRSLDTALPVRFGFREFWIDGRDFYLNGTRIYFSALPIDNAQGTPLIASYDGARATMQRLKSFGINFVYTHNYGCEPGAHLSFHDLLRAADDEGMLLSFSQPHFSHYDWTAPDADKSNGYARHAAFYVHLAENHPSVIFYSMSHNATGYAEDMNPDMMDGLQDKRDQWATRNRERALRAGAIVSKLDPSRIVYHHASGNLGPMHVSNFYGNWIPVQEMSDWFEHWSKAGVKPVFTCEYSVPFMWDWSMYRGWYKGKREFGSAVVPWELSVAEWDAQFLGDQAYKVTDDEKAVIRWEAQKIGEGKGWLRWDAPQSLNTQVFDDRYKVVAAYLQDNWRAFRTWGMSANSPWDYGGYWKQPRDRERDRADLDLAIDWDNLQRPGPRVPFVKEDEARAQLAFHPAEFQPTLAAQALYRNNMPLLGYIAGKPAAFTTKDHNFVPGETVEKLLVVINNSRKPVSCETEWSFRGATTRGRVTLPTGQQQRIPLKVTAPDPGRYELKATFRFDTGETQEDAFTLDVMPQPAAAALPPSSTSQPSSSSSRPPSSSSPSTRDRNTGFSLSVFDPQGETTQLLKTLSIPYHTVDANATLNPTDLLVIGKHALTLNNAAPDVTRVRDGLRVILFEQTGEVLEKRLGFRIAEYGLRQLFRRVPDHPLLAGLTEETLRDWRGESTNLPPRLAYEMAPQLNNVPAVKWAGVTVSRVWRNGNRGNVASALIEKPAHGDFLPVLDGGYSLQYSPLLVHRDGKGMVLLCQLDVTGRTESDPAAETIVRNILRYAAGWKPQAATASVYVADEEGKAYLQSIGVTASGKTNAGRILALGLNQQQANEIAPVKMTVKEYISTYFEAYPADSPFAGISPAEVHNRSPRNVALIDGGVLAVSSNAVFSQLAPWQFKYGPDEMNKKRTFRKVAVMTARLLGNQGISPPTSLLTNIAKAPGGADKRWLDGLYLDVPEEWDDPYRFFRW